jgi:hypothetical protein
LGVHLRGPSVWIVWQLLQEPIRDRIRQLERDVGVHRDVVRQLRGTATDLEMGAREYREWTCSDADSVEVPESVSEEWLGVGLVAADLNCSARWVTALCQQGRLAALKRGRSWFIDPSSVEDFKQRGVRAA